MSGVWEFAVSPARLAVVAGCLALAIPVAGGAGFAAGVLLAPRFASAKPVLSAGKAKPVAAKAAAPKPEPPAPAKLEPVIAGKQAQSVIPAVPEGNVAIPVESRQAAKGAVEHVPPIRLDVQVGSFSDEKNARSTVDRLQRSGYPASVFQWTDAQSRNWHVVQVGPYAAYEAASGIVLELATRYKLDPVIIPAKGF